MRKSAVRRFMDKVLFNPVGCWEWVARKSPDGYGEFWNGRRIQAYRFSYAQRHGVIPDGLEIDHLCLNRACVRPSHLELVSRAENNRRTAARGRLRQQKVTECPRGHEYNDVNTRVYAGRRHCRVCARDGAREKYRNDPQHAERVRARALDYYRRTSK